MIRINHNYSKTDLALHSILILLVCFAFQNVLGQKKVDSHTLEGTEWYVTKMDYYTPYKIETVVYILGKEGKAALYLSATTLRDYRRAISDPMDLTPLNFSELHKNGSFTQEGMLVRIEFPGHIIEAEVDGLIMKGVIKEKASDKTTKWQAERLVNKKL